MQLHVCAVGHQPVAEGTEDVVELVALLHQLLLHHQAGLHLLASAAFKAVQVQQPADNQGYEQQQRRCAAYQPCLVQLHPRSAENDALLLHHAPAQVELLHGPQVVEESAFPVGEPQRRGLCSFQHLGGHQSRLVAHVVWLHVVGAEAAVAHGQVLEGINGGGKRVGCHEGHELRPVGRDDNVVGRVFRVANFLYHPGGHFGQQVIHLPAVSRMPLLEHFPISIQLLQALSAISARIGNANEFFPFGKHAYGFVQQGCIVVAYGEAACVGALRQFAGQNLHAGAYNRHFP